MSPLAHRPTQAELRGKAKSYLLAGDRVSRLVESVQFSHASFEALALAHGLTKSSYSDLETILRLYHHTRAYNPATRS